MLGRCARWVVPAAAAAVLMAACGGSGDDRAAPSTPTPTSTAGRTATPGPTPVPVPTTTARAPSPTGSSPTPAPVPTTAPVPPAWCAGRDVEVLPTDRRVVALTVDMGASSGGLDSILRTLGSGGVRATFFVTGDWTRHDEPGLRRIAAAGHVIGNHSGTHPELTTLTDAAVRAELADAEQRVVAVTGRTTRPLFRFPFGDRDARTIGVVNASGYCAFRWTVDTLGWKGTSGGQSVQTVVTRVAAALRPGAVVLMHGGANPDDGSTLDADALPAVLQLLRDRGYATTTLPG